MITLRGITLRRGVRSCWTDASATLQPGEGRPGLGRNLAPAVQLFALLTDACNRGQLQDLPRHWRPLGQVAQNMPGHRGGATDFVLRATPAGRPRRIWRRRSRQRQYAMGRRHMALHDAGAVRCPVARPGAADLGLASRPSSSTRRSTAFRRLARTAAAGARADDARPT